MIDDMPDHTSAPVRRQFPQSTYRIQFHAGFTFADARKIVPYLRDLGITHVYASPILKARIGSTHGYDVTNPHVLNPELGTPADFEAYTDALKTHGLEQILDIVPNHMGVATNDNAWWNDVLENGPGSRYAGYFDITWRGSCRLELNDKVLLPVLGEPYGDALEQGKLKLVRESGEFFVAYFDRRFPLNSASRELVSHSNNISEFNGTPGDSHSFDRLDDLLAGQFYRLAYWRTAANEVNYRRFFDINDLAALRMESEDVFRDSHPLIFQLLDEGKISGLRIDHPDGLSDPAQYFQRLQQAAMTNTDVERSKIPSLYVVAEKILADAESLPNDWPVHGTTGYDFINNVNGLFIEVSNEPAFTRQYLNWVGGQTPFDEISYQKKCLTLETGFAGDLEILARQFDRLAQANRHWQDFTSTGIRNALREVIAHFPVYRTYISNGVVSDRDREVVNSAIAVAVERNSRTDPAVFHFIQSVLLESGKKTGSDRDESDRCLVVTRFQQLTAPVMAKGIEDTAFYIYNRLVSLNEVGGDPAIFGVAPASLHQWLRQRAADWPHALSPLSTHDTKRSEDVRARLNVLSEIPGEWWQGISLWSQTNEPHRRVVDGEKSPDRNDEYLLYQTLLGAWPLESGEAAESTEFVTRIQDYMRKAMREGKAHTSWTDPNLNYEGAVSDFIGAILSGKSAPEFLRDFLAFQHRVSEFGLLNSLAQTLLRLTAPGVPDTYQGTDLWDFSLVDPDNRRPVDYDLRRQIIGQFAPAITNGHPGGVSFARDLISHRRDGRIKLFLIQQCLHTRREHPTLFTSGEYIPVEVVGSRHEHVFSFIRRDGASWALVTLPRLMTRLVHAGELPLGIGVWGDTRLVLPAKLARIRLRDIFTGEVMVVNDAPDGLATIQVADLFAHLPLALLMAVD